MSPENSGEFINSVPTPEAPKTNIDFNQMRQEANGIASELGAQTEKIFDPEAKKVEDERKMEEIRAELEIGNTEDKSDVSNGGESIVGLGENPQINLTNVENLGENGEGAQNNLENDSQNIEAGEEIPSEVMNEIFENNLGQELLEGLGQLDPATREELNNILGKAINLYEKKIPSIKIYLLNGHGEGLLADAENKEEGEEESLFKEFMKLFKAFVILTLKASSKAIESIGGGEEEKKAA